jgi:prepilin-type N-terminal cleavage/methylation domain-containing protein
MMAGGKIRGAERRRSGSSFVESAFPPTHESVHPVPRRFAFTLLELLLTLAVLAAIAAVAIPQTGILLGDRRLVRAGDQLRVEMTRLRVDAMRQGRVIMLEGMVEGNSFRIKPFFSISDSTEALDQTGSQSGLLTGATQGIAVPVDVDESSEQTIELPEAVFVTSVGVVSAARASEIEQATLANQGQGWSRPILFYPDGSTSTALITLSHETVGKVVVKIRGITGDVTVSEVLPL